MSQAPSLEELASRMAIEPCAEAYAGGKPAPRSARRRWPPTSPWRIYEDWLRRAPECSKIADRFSTITNQSWTPTTDPGLAEPGQPQKP